MKLFDIINKNFKIFLRSRVSALIIFLGPLLLVSLIGMSFSNTQLPGLSVGLYSPNYNDFTNSIVDKIQQNSFAIKKFDTGTACSDAVKRGDSNICLLFPQDMSATNNEVTFVVDYSKINLVWIVIDIFNSKVSERATELRTNYATELIKKVIQTTDDLNKDKTDIAALNSKQSQAQSTVKNTLDDLNGISPTTDLGDTVAPADVKSSLTSINSQLISAKSNIDNAKSNVLSSSTMADSEKSAVLSKLSSASSSIDSSFLYLQGNATTKSLEFMMNNILTALSNAKSQLQQIKDQKAVVSGDVIAVQQGISDSISSLSSIDSAVSAMITRIQDVKSSDTEQLVSPIKTKIEPVTTEETHFNYLFPTLIVLVIMITGILLSSTLVMNEKKSRSYFRNFITPTTDSEFNLGTFLTSFLAILIQLAIFLVISSLFFNTEIISSILSSLVVLVLITSVFILLGMLIGFIFKSEETYVLASITVAALLMFLSSTILPIESISNSVRAFASFTPFVVSENALRQVMFFHFSLTSLWAQITVLLGYVIVFAGAIFAAEKLMRHKLFELRIVKKETKK